MIHGLPRKSSRRIAVESGVFRPESNLVYRTQVPTRHLVEPMCQILRAMLLSIAILTGCSVSVAAQDPFTAAKGNDG